MSPSFIEPDMVLCNINSETRRKENGVTSMQSDTSNYHGTNQTISGETESSTQKHIEVEVGLDRYERGLGVPSLGEDEITEQARRLMTLPMNQLRKMSAGEAGEAAYVMGVFSFRIQQAVNREQARVTYAEESIKSIISTTIANFCGASFEERRMQAVRIDDVAVKLDTVRVKAKLRADRVSFLSAKASDLAKILMSIQATKRARNEE